MTDNQVQYFLIRILRFLKIRQKWTFSLFVYRIDFVFLRRGISVFGRMTSHAKKGFHCRFTFFIALFCRNLKHES